jgi:hypothetical protein
MDKTPHMHSDSETGFKVLQVTEKDMPGGARHAEARPEGSRRGRDTYQMPNQTERNKHSKSLSRKMRD